MRRAGLERMMLLRSFPQLAEIPPVHLAAMAELAEEEFFPAGAEILAEDRAVQQIHYVLEGAVELRRRGRPTRRLGSRSVLGGLAVLAGTSDQPQVVAVEDTTTFSFTQEDQLDVFEDNFELLVGVIRAVAGEFIDARRAAGPGAGFEGDAEGAPIPGQPLGLVEKLAVLRRSVPFGEARLEALAEVARESPERRFAAGERIWSAGDPAGHGLMMVAGVVEGVAEGGRQRFRFSSRSVVGGLDSLAGRPRWFEATALTETVGLVVPTGALLDLFEDHVDMAMDLLRVMAGGILALRAQIDGDKPARTPEGA
ncbi:MAG TPA: cyclic nucleotide-binding domain-containing protein [Kofleriaceae bacterium]|nr:cyclic nucleotide-binding domain-containing protein [Kofleriaceae bacterium]